MKGLLVMYVQIVLFDGFDPLDVIAPYEVLWAGGMVAGAALTVELVSAEGSRAVTGGSGGLVLRATSILDPDKADLIIVPGAAGPISAPSDESQIATIPILLARTMQTDLPTLMRKALDNPRVTVATVCGGSLALAMAGILEGRHVVTHHMGMDVLGSTGAIPIHARVVDDGNLVTSGGVTSGLDLGLYLLERELGPRIAHAVEELFEYERRGTIWHNRGLSAVAIESSLPSSPPVARALAGKVMNERIAIALTGTWNISIATPIGTQSVVLELTEHDGVVEGIAKGNAETTPLINPVLDGHRLTWKQAITKPMRLNLAFDVTIDGNTLIGTSKAGMLPASKVTGTRVV
jgi:putative intracellular protease/amidase